MNGSSNCRPSCEHNHTAIGLNELWSYSTCVRTSPITLVDSSISVWMYISYMTCVEVGWWSSGIFNPFTGNSAIWRSAILRIINKNIFSQML